MIFSFITLFPDCLNYVLKESIIGKSIKKGLIKINYYNPRDFATDNYKSVDGKPYGGGQGMILRIDTMERAINHALKNSRSIPREKTLIILTDPKGHLYTQKTAERLASQYFHLIIIAGHYEGVDARIKYYTDESISIGNYILTGGEIPALVIADSVTRLIPGVLKSEKTYSEESFSMGKLEYPQYTTPRVYKGRKVPQILLSGNHAKIDDWKKKMSKSLSKP